jgi:hypothetical protein
MGEAKRRGSYEERKALAIVKQEQAQRLAEERDRERERERKARLEEIRAEREKLRAEGKLGPESPTGRTSSRRRLPGMGAMMASLVVSSMISLDTDTKG